jgi:membrane protease YdiL (CAAX protease family)
MIEKTTLSLRKSTDETRYMKSFRGLLGIVVAFTPLLVLGSTGTRLGAGTLLGGLVITFGYVLSIMVASLVLKVQGTSWREIGLARPTSWLRTVLLGIGALVGAVLVISAVTVTALNLPGLAIEPADVSRFNPMEGNLPLFLGYLVVAWTTITFSEEMFFRAFLTSELAGVFQNTKVGWALGVIGSSAAFGLAHYQEGPVGMLSTGAFGFLFALIYLRTGRNLWVTIIAHGLLNTLRFVLIFSGAG